MRTALLTAAVLAACLTAAHARQDKDKDKPKRTEPTQDFVTKAAESFLAEVELGRLAAKRAEDKGLREFAGRMADEHGKLNKELTELAGKKRLEVPEKADAEHARIAQALAPLKGPPFDRRYVDRRVGDQAAVLGMFERQARGGTDADVKAWAEKKLPGLRANLRAAQRLQRRLEGGPRDADDPKDKRKDTGR